MGQVDPEELLKLEEQCRSIEKLLKETLEINKVSFAAGLVALLSLYTQGCEAVDMSNQDFNACLERAKCLFISLRTKKDQDGEEEI